MEFRTKRRRLNVGENTEVFSYIEHNTASCGDKREFYTQAQWFVPNAEPHLILKLSPDKCVRSGNVILWELPGKSASR